MRYIVLLFIALFASASFASEPVLIDNVQVAEKYAVENDKRLALVFIADWCSYCKPLQKDIMNNLEEIQDQGWIVCFVDYDSNKDLVRKYNIQAVPTTILINGSSRKSIRGYGGSYESFQRNLK
jgi:thioredoxin-related protein